MFSAAWDALSRKIEPNSFMLQFPVLVSEDLILLGDFGLACQCDKNHAAEEVCQYKVN